MATPDQIPSDLTIEIDGGLPPERFMAVARAFFGYIHEISKALSPEGEGTDWVVRVKEGSNLIGIDPGPKAHMAVVKRVYSAAHVGVQKVRSGDLEESRLTDAALRHLRQLSEIGNEEKRRPIPIRLWIEKAPITLDQTLVRIIDDDWRANYNDYGTVEGVLETIQDRGSLQINVRDKLLRQSVHCFVPEELLAKAFASFRQRVEVSGLIRYRKNGMPISINVNDIDLLPDDEDLPGIDAVRGILSDREWLPSQFTGTALPSWPTSKRKLGALSYAAEH